MPEDDDQLIRHLEAILIEIKRSLNITITVTLRSRFPVTDHLDQIDQGHIVNAVLMELWVVWIVPVMVFDGGSHRLLYFIILIAAIGKASQLGGVLSKNRDLWRRELAQVVLIRTSH